MATTSNHGQIYVYIGPSIRRLITQNHVFFGDLASVKAELAEALDKVPSILPLIIPVDNLAEARRNIKISGTPEYAHKKRILRELQR